MKILVDTREHNEDIFDTLDILSSEKGFEWEKATLETGDVVCGNVCIERKEAGDFVGSITTGHLKEQCAKMCLNFPDPNGHKYLILEGDPYTTRSNMNINAITGQMTSLAVKYNIKLVYVPNAAQFVYA